MIDSRHVFLVCVFFGLLLATAVTGFSQPSGGASDQSQQNSQTGQGSADGSQMQQGQGMRQGMGFGQAPGQGQQPEQMQKMISDRLKQLLGSTDEEWAVIGPKVLKAYTLTSSQSRGFQMRSLMGRPGNQGTNTNASVANNRASAATGDKALEELQTLLQNKDATSAQIKIKLNEVRKAKEKTSEELAKAQKELRELLTLKQEATLVSVGLLE
jgi:hypothetical protein